MNATGDGASAQWTAAEAEDWLLERELFGMRFGMDRMLRLLTALDSPQQSFDAIHVVGTNGKSSTVRMTAAILEAHGVATGSYLSPHLTSFSERIRIGDEDIDHEAFAAALARVRIAAERVDRTLADGDRVTQFEAITAAAFVEFARRGVDVAVVEAGLGGRFDATNVIDGKVVVLTNVGLEHTQLLGPTVAHIAREKLAVVPTGATLVIGPDLDPAARAEADGVVVAQRARLVVAGYAPGITLQVLGDFQHMNFGAAMEAARAQLGKLDREAVDLAARQVAVPGRFQRVSTQPDTIFDGAHNTGGMQALVASLPAVVGDRRLIGVFSVLDDKDAASMLGLLLPHCKLVIATRNSNPRALSPATVQFLADDVSGGTAPMVQVEPNPHRALARARKEAREDGVVLVTGSIYLLADVMRGPDAKPGATL